MLQPDFLFVSEKRNKRTFFSEIFLMRSIPFLDSGRKALHVNVSFVLSLQEIFENFYKLSFIQF